MVHSAMFLPLYLCDNLGGRGKQAFDQRRPLDLADGQGVDDGTRRFYPHRFAMRKIKRRKICHIGILGNPAPVKAMLIIQLLDSHLITSNLAL
nr:MAG TPA: hypothetical protein [Caudoviricetes sp.]